jgi:hypothetical protein
MHLVAYTGIRHTEKIQLYCSTKSIFMLQHVRTKESKPIITEGRTQVHNEMKKGNILDKRSFFGRDMEYAHKYEFQGTYCSHVAR